MRLPSPRLRPYVRRALSTLAIVGALATTVLAQLGTFNPAFDGELWGVRRELTPANDGVPAGIAFSGGTMFVADTANQTVIAYDSGGQVVSIPNAAWDAANPASPVFGLVPHQILAATVRVNGANRAALLISDAQSNRVAAFRVTGEHLFTLRLQRPSADPTYQLSIGQLAMSSGARFNLNTTTSTLTVTGTFVAAWFEQLMTGRVNSGALVYREGTASFASSGSEYTAASSAVLNGSENNPAAPQAQMVFGVTFDTSGNLYVLDAFTERLHVYAPDLSRLFTFGTPVADGTTAEFYEPWGLLFYPDAAGTGGRLFINDTYNSRILSYRPVDGADADTVIDALAFASVIEDFLTPPMELFSIAVDTATGRLAVSDFAIPRVVVLQQPRLAAFNIQVLDSSDQVIESVCTASQYKVRFTLTVPAGQAAVNNVTPQLSINGVAAAGPPVGAPSPTPLAAGQAATYTYTLTAPATLGADLLALAGATASNTTDIMQRSEMIPLANCAGETDPSTITATPSRAPQVSGWTPVFESETFNVTLAAQDDDGIESIEYELEGANLTAGNSIATDFDGDVTDASVVVPLPDMGRTAVRYRVRDGNGIWSPWQTLNVRTKLVVNRVTNENSAVEFRVGDPEGVGYTYSVSTLPAGVTFSAATGQFAGVVSFDAVQPYSSDPSIASGIFNIVVTETAPGGATSNVAFTWTVNHINRAPIITTTAPVGLTIQQGANFTFQINGFDPDDDPTVYTVRGRSPSGRELPPSITIDRDTGLISGVFPLDSDTSYDIVVGLAECGPATDPPCPFSLPGIKLATLLGFNVGVLDANLPADVVNPGPQLSAEGAVVSLPITASDAEGDTLTYIAAGLPPGLSINPTTGVIGGTLSYESAGAYAVTVKVDDHVNTPPRSVTFAWTVTATNRAPVATFPNRVSNEGWSIGGESIGGFASDPDGSVVTFAGASGLPPGVSISPTGALSGQLDYDDAGIYQVTVTLTDGDLSSTSGFTWTVNNINRAPELEVANRFSREGVVVSYQLPASDPDGDALFFTFNGLPPGLTLNENTGLITGTLPAGSAGTYLVNIGLRDVVPEGSQSILRTFTWTVTNVNRAPTAAADAATVTQLASVNINVLGNDSDPDGDPLTVVGVGMPSSGTAVINPDGTITFTATSSVFSGVATFTYTISDGTATATATVSITIVPNNAPPVCTAATGGEIWPPNHNRFYIAGVNGVTDADGDPLTITVTGIWQDEVLDSTGDGTFAPDGRIENGQAWVRAERNGHGNKAKGNGRVYEILFTAADGKGGSCSGSVLWTVPHDRGQRSTAIDDLVRYDSTGVVAGARNKSQIHQKSATP